MSGRNKKGATGRAESSPFDSAQDHTRAIPVSDCHRSGGSPRRTQAESAEPDPWHPAGVLSEWNERPAQHVAEDRTA